MTQERLIDILYIFIPLISGASLAAIGLARKYPTVQRYVYSSWPGILYMLLSSGGALLLTQVTRVIGTRVIEHELLNCILQGLLGAGLFIGIISRISIAEEADSEVGSQLKTLRDYIYEFLDSSIKRRIMQVVESKIKTLGKRVDINLLLEEATRLIGGPTSMTIEQKEKLMVDFDEWASRGDYASIIRELNKYYEVDYIIEELADCILNHPDDNRQMNS